ncbi:MAG: metal-dependent hydrolase [Vicinamibacterales bacterium]
MASFGHVAVGMAAARMHSGETDSRRSRPLVAMVLWSLLSLSPDLDVIGFSLGVKYEDEWGHRGATHSLVCSGVIGAATGLTATLIGRAGIQVGVGAALVLASHALLDTLTDGGLGCALFWQFDRTRYFAPWNPIPVAPIGADFVSVTGLMVSAIELVLFAPLAWFALRSPVGPPRWKLRACAGTAWLIAVWFMTSSDPVRQRAVGLLLREDTEFAAGFSESALNKTKLGESSQDVHTRLGPPLNQLWFYRSVYPSGCFAVALKDDIVISARDPERCRQLGVRSLISRADAEQQLGRANEVCWVYTRSRNGSYYRAREVCFAGDRVVDVIRQWHRD